MLRIGLSLLMVGYLGGAVAEAAVEVADVRVWAAPDRTRIVLDTDRPAPHRLFTLSDPERVVVDVRGARLGTATLPAGDGVVRRIRSARQPTGDLRVVLDLDRTANAKSFLLTPNAQYGHRLVIDLETASGAAPMQRPAAPARGRDIIVAIDAGHGGEDPGALGRLGTQEKDVVLAISRELARQIDAEPGFGAYLTREGDYYLSLRERIEKARLARADLFVSVHADAVRNSGPRGSSVYVLSERGASDEAARWLAVRQNASDLIGGVSLADKDDVLASVLLDLSQTASVSASMTVGEKVIAALARVGRVHRAGVQHAGFLVLKSPDIPSILVETAFISNPQEERKLRDAAQQRSLATAILSGVRDFFEASPPPITRLALEGPLSRSRTLVHVIGRGDTLSAIADRYQVTLRSLREANQLTTDRIVVGETIQIPARAGL
ncbi:N-acetylmuramoyl-L-alanine amidase AmiB [soil metagenome]